MAKNPYTLRYPVYSLEKKEILPAGTTLTPGLLKELKSTYGYSQSETVNILSHGPVKQDLTDFFSKPPYSVIFWDPVQTRLVMEVMSKVKVVPPVLESLDYFKINDPYTYRHMLLVFALSTRMSQELIKDRDRLIEFASAPSSHDFGKISVPLDLLLKDTPLTKEERYLLGHHALAGYVLLECYIDEPDPLAARVARDHHERNDGGGYPLGIPIPDSLVEIVAVSDHYDALVSPRPYRNASFDNRAALEEICDLARKKKFNWDIVKTLVVCNRREEIPPAECRVSEEKRSAPPKDNLYGTTSD
ncbi:MAG: hypothetical protein GY940_05430 [bacterium]|nr:hypothetical protein [bacterium]